MTTLIVGALYVTSWKDEYNNWADETELWELSDQNKPTFKKGTSPDAMALALGRYFPVGILPAEAGEEGVREATERFPLYVTGNPVLGGHMALFLTFYAIWPDLQANVRRYNVKNFRR